MLLFLKMAEFWCSSSHHIVKTRDLSRGTIAFANAPRDVGLITDRRAGIDSLEKCSIIGRLC